MKNEQRIVLNLNMNQAKELNKFLVSRIILPETASLFLKLQARISKTITKHETSQVATQ